MGDEPKGLRWAVNSTAWAPTVDDLAFALACVQPEERDRIGRFYFQRDAKLALLGTCLWIRPLPLPMRMEPEHGRTRVSRDGVTHAHECLDTGAGH